MVFCYNSAIELREVLNVDSLRQVRDNKHPPGTGRGPVNRVPEGVLGR